MENCNEDKKLKDNFIFTFKNGDYKGKTYKIVIDYICDDPTCNCSDIGIIAYDNENETEKYNFSVDIDKKNITKDKKNDLSKKDIAFAKSFVTELEEKDWDYIEKYFFDYKQMVTEKADIDNIDYIFEIDDIEGDDEFSMMISYRDVFPYSTGFPFILEDVKYIVEDQYDLNSKNNYTNVILSFYDFSDKEEPLFDILYDYEKKEWEEVDEEVFSDKQNKTILEHFKSLYPDFSDVFEKRHKDLRKIYSNFKEKVGESPKKTVTKNVKVGRNEPCPCGSGKKYKKCCGS